MVGTATADGIYVMPGQTYESATGLGGKDKTPYNLGANDQLDPNQIYGFGSPDILSGASESIWPSMTETGLAYIAIVGTLSYPHPVALNWVTIATTAGGQVVLFTDGTFNYTPPSLTYQGVDHFTYALVDSSWNMTTAEVTLTVGDPSMAPPQDPPPVDPTPVDPTPVDPTPVDPTPVDPTPTENYAPIAVDDNVRGSHHSSMSVNVLANDSDPEGAQINVILIEELGFQAIEAGTYAVRGGKLTIDMTGQVAFEADQGFTGQRSFTYTISDGEKTATASVTFDVTNDDAFARDDYFTTNYGKIIHNTLNVLANDTDADGDALAVTPCALVRTANGGLVSVNRDGTFVYTPKFGFYGEDSFSYEVSDGIGKCSIATARINVEPPKGAILGTSANETLSGGQIADTVLAGSGKDTVYGNGGNDLLLGDGGSDSIDGGDGADIIDGGANGDKLTGGKGFDKFVLGQSTATDYDRIMDYTAGEKLVVYGADYGLAAGAALDSSYLVKSGAASSGHGRFVYDASAKSLYWDSGEQGANLQLLTTFANKVSLSSADFEVV